ncbi:histidine kinase osmosensor, partial [Podila epicladia]
MAADMTCDRLFHTAGMIHVSVMRVLLARVHLRDCMAATMDLVAKQIEFGPKSHGVEVMQGILQLIKCLKGQTFSANPDTLFDDGEFAESRMHGKRDKALVMVHNNSTYMMLKIVAAFVFGHYAFIAEVTSTWHDDPKSMMNFEGSWIAHSIFTVVGLALVNLLRTELDPEVRESYKKRISVIHDCMETRANKYPTNHAAMFHLLQAEIADQEETKDMKKVLLLYEKSIAYATTGDFPLQKAFCYELAAKCHIRHGLVTSGRCLLMNSCKTYQNWGATGKVNWFYKTYQDMFGSPPEIEATAPTRGLFYRPSDSDFYHSSTGHSLGHSGPHTSSSSSGADSTMVGATSPWSSGSPKTMYSPGGYGNDAVSAAAAAIAESAMATSIQTGCPSATSTSSSISAPLNTLQNSWTASPQSPEIDNADLDVLDFSSVIEAMQVIASEIDLDLLLVKSLGVLNQSDDPRFCADDYLKQRTDLRTVLCAPILHKTVMVGVLYMEEFPERAFANKRMLVMNLLVQQLGISITNALLYQSVLQSETKLNGLLENMPCGIALWDATAEQCQYINSSWKDMTGYTVDEIMETGWHILTHADEVATYIQHWRDRVLAGVPCQWESRYKLKDGTYRWAIVRMLPIKSPSERNKIIQWLTVTIDIDDQRRAVQLKSNFLANMSHELRTPFSGILGMLSLLRDSSGLSHEQFEFVDMAKASCEMLIRIVDDLLNFSKLEADKVTLEYIPLCFEEILGDVCDLLVPLASRKGLELIILIDDTLPLLLIGDPDRMKQILMNLIGNAIKFSTTGNVVIEFHHELIKRSQAVTSSSRAKTRTLMHTYGPVTVQPITKCASTETDEKKLGDEVVLHCSVKDQGIGLSPEEQKMLFVSFQQTDNGTTRKYGGTGLGLSICAQLIAHMHGKIEVDSVKGQGATFSFTAKLRTMTPFDQEQSPAESSRIMECDVILAARLKVIKDKKVLILSPNRQLRAQIIRVLKGAICSEFDNVITALESRAIGITGMEPTSGIEAGDPCCAVIPQFDFILVDHVLDTAELDRIYPSPTVAFVLLLAPTTETLRWILPPAAKNIQGEPEEMDSARIDIGGRGRILPSDSNNEVPGRIQLSPPALISKSGLSTRDPSSSPSAAGKPASMPRLSKKPSQLFKKRKHSRGPVTLARHENQSRTIPESTYADVGDSGNKATPPKPTSSSSSFQVYRLIKPVRRMKLLQILFNAITQHETGEHAVDRISELMDTDSAEEHDMGEDNSSDAYMGSSPACSGSGHSSRIGSPSTDGTARSESGLPKRRRSKVAGQKRTHPRSVDWSESDTSCDAGDGNEARSRSRAAVEKQRRTMEEGNMPKRARNNDALTLLLSAEEREKCLGKNVLVAEDDFVSQKILEKQLSKLGMNVTIAGNGLEAVNQWLSVERGHYTIAIFDHHMPIMDGLAATRKLRALEAQEAQDSAEATRSIRIPIVGLSADIQQSTKESCIKAGMDEYMTKPLLTKGLALLIQR